MRRRRIAHEVHQGDFSESDTNSIPSSVESAEKIDEGCSASDEECRGC